MVQKVRAGLFAPTDPENLASRSFRFHSLKAIAKADMSIRGTQGAHQLAKHPQQGHRLTRCFYTQLIRRVVARANRLLPARSVSALAVYARWGDSRLPRVLFEPKFSSQIPNPGPTARTARRHDDYQRSLQALNRRQLQSASKKSACVSPRT